MQNMYYIGLDVHKRTISYCVKDGSGAIHSEGTLPATRLDLDFWMKTLPQPWTAAMEATAFTGWIYDHLQPHAAALKRQCSLARHRIRRFVRRHGVDQRHCRVEILRRVRRGFAPARARLGHREPFA